MPDVREVYEMITKQKLPEPGALERQQKRQVRAARNTRVGAFVVVAAICLVAAALVLLTRGGQHKITPAKEPPTVAPGTGSLPFLLDLRTDQRTPLAESLAGGLNYVASPDGTRLAYGTSHGGGCDGEAVVTVANIDGTDARTLQSPKGLIYCAPRWSPDGTKLVYQERNGAKEFSVGNLFVQDLSTGRRTQITHLELSRAWWWFLSPRFTPDGRNLIFQLPRSSSETTKWDVWSVPVAGGQPALVLMNAAFPMYFPDGKEIAFVSPTSSNFAGRSILIADASGARRTLVEASNVWWPTISPGGSRIAYQDGGSIYVVDVSTGQSSKVAVGDSAEWLDNNTLIVGP